MAEQTRIPALNLTIAGLKLNNPVLTASGTFGYGLEFDDFINVNDLGGIIVKGTTFEHREGNPYPRMAETPAGMLNAVGLQNKGLDYFIHTIYPKITKYTTNILVNVCGSDLESYVACAEKLNDLPHLAGIELNISCPNVKAGCMAFGTSPEGTREVVSAVRAVYSKPLIVKLTPNVTDITVIAKAAEAGGADAVSLINTLMGLAINAETRKPVLSTVTGGLSGPAVKPVALRMVWQVYKSVKIPIIGLGGIMNAADALEFLLAGASAIQVGTANFINPAVSIEIIQGIKDYLLRHQITDIRQLIGAAHA